MNNRIIVLFSNIEGIHSEELKKYGAMPKIGDGFTGTSYTIPLYSLYPKRQELDFESIKSYFEKFQEFVEEYQEYTFEIIDTKEYDLKKISPLFNNISKYENIIFPKSIKKQKTSVFLCKKMTMNKIRPHLKGKSLYIALTFAINNPEIVGIQDCNDDSCLFMLKLIKYFNNE